MQRTLTLITASALLAASATGLASASGGREKLQLRHTSVGTILANGRGFTVYAFTRDGRNSDACQRLHGCLAVWPAVPGNAIARAGVKSSLIGTITLKSGAKQATYAGHPLYTYRGDSRAGQTSYVNFSAFGGRWPALNASGREVK